MNRTKRCTIFTTDARHAMAASADGVIKFRLARRPRGVHVERVHLREGPARVVQSVTFSDVQSFVRWCNADRLKFDYPLVYSSLRRDGEALFDDE